MKAQMKRKERGRVATWLLVVLFMLASAGFITVAHSKHGKPDPEKTTSGSVKASATNLPAAKNTASNHLQKART